MQQRFMKLQGLGNDFIVMEGPALPQGLHLSDLARRLCGRHFGIGADGLILNWPDPVAAARMQILNADGSEPEMCGNGLRCLVRYLQLRGDNRPELQIQTGAGLRQVLSEGPQIAVNMGQPAVSPEERLDCAGQTFVFTAVSMGNPHCVIRVPELNSLDFAFWGPRLSAHVRFKAQTNVEFVEVLSPQHARVKVWERGAGPTLACGTGACAVLAAGITGGWLAREARIELPGGSLTISWADPATAIWMRGPAQKVFIGEIELEEDHA
ncbi:MAG: diaminopimelate epimerase [Candidatus Sericytochromatia bacterium]|nr:diaminopimelate epimerase [Candidatus Sericytochromatia bacterium]